MTKQCTDPDAILAALSHARGPMTPTELADRLEVGDRHAEYEAALAELEHAGRIVRNRAGLLLVAARANLLSGKVQGHRDGYGFLIRDDGGPDLVLSEHEMSRVLHGDRVLARPAGEDRRGRPLGEIVEVIEHRTDRLVGRLLNERGVLVVVPEDQRITHDILVPPGAAAGASCSAWKVCIALTMMAMNRFSIVKVATRMNGTKNAHANGNCSITGRAIPIDQLSSVITWNSVYSESPSVPNHCGNASANSLVAITPNT